VRLCLFVLLLLSAPALLIACGDSSADDEITQLTKQFAADVEDEDWESVCDAMSAEAAAEVASGAAVVGGGDCAAVMARLYALDDSPEILPTSGGDDVTVSRVKVTGDRATAEVEPAFEGQDPTMRYVREDGEWKLDVTPGR
jgi:hypothetical protein